LLGIQDLTNLEVFLTAKEVEESLQAGGIDLIPFFSRRVAEQNPGDPEYFSVKKKKQLKY
jgi:hypothetical protein